MSTRKVNSHSSKTSSCRCTTSRPSSVKSAKPRVANPKRVLPSSRIPQNPSSNRTCSAGLLNDNKKTTKPKKTTKSDFSVIRDQTRREAHFDYCKTCGDVVASSIYVKRAVSDSKSVQSTSTNTKSDTKNTKNNKSGNSRHSNGYSERTKPESVKQYYRNENYRLSESTEEISNGIKKIFLDPIKEVSEIHPSDFLFKIYPDDSEEDITFLDVDNQENLEQLKEFRKKNYFECHSAKSRIKNKGSATSLAGHRCVYRFYLNERLFPVPLNADLNNQVRCVECHLPMELNVEDATKVNGTIQAKVSIGKKNQDIMLLLPVKEPLIITEKRREDKPKDREVVFFGVINLDGFGNSMFNPTLPGNSFALKYQKGYHEFESKENYSYRDLDKADVVVI